MHFGKSESVFLHNRLAGVPLNVKKMEMKQDN